jgi:phosphatidylserine decarboxylase
MRFDRAGYPFVGGAWLLALVLWITAGEAFAVPFIALGAFFAFFFRDPDRVSPADGGHLVLSPADGRVLVAGAALPGAAPDGEWQQVSIFLSPMDVHVNRVPAAGTITRVLYRPGRFLVASRKEAATENERSEIWIDHGGQTIVARQVVGFLARRVVCRATVGDEVRAGDRFGVMKFGSRMDVFLPMNATIRVKVGEMVSGGETVIAVLD